MLAHVCTPLLGAHKLGAQSDFKTSSHAHSIDLFLDAHFQVSRPTFWFLRQSVKVVNKIVSA